MESTYIFVEGLFLDIATLQSWDSTQFLFLERGNKTDSGGGSILLYWQIIWIRSLNALLHLCRMHFNIM